MRDTLLVSKTETWGVLELGEKKKKMKPKRGTEKECLGWN